jgi:tetraacyldisaccharide 4'-kinase
MQLVQRLWYGEGAAERVARAVLAPAGWAYAAAMRMRNALYDRGVLAAHVAGIPVLSLGNLSVGGTGKTPIAAWAAARLLAEGARPAIVLRGYGGDEPLVHQRLNPEAIVVVDGDRVRGVTRAAALGADCAVLDDAFQHRRLRRQADWVLVAAEQWRGRASARSLPAGPLREGAGALRRADLLIVTRKSASREEAEGVLAALLARVAVPESAICHLSADELVACQSGAREPLSWLAGRRVLAIAAVGDPEAFHRQLRQAGAEVEEARYRDHHRFTAADVAHLVGCGARVDRVLCTLKDAVKLAPLWPAAAPALWYVSQRALFERGGASLAASLQGLLAARAGAAQTAGSAGSSSTPHGHRSSIADR